MILTGETLKGLIDRSGVNLALWSVNKELIGYAPEVMAWDCVDSLIDLKMLYGRGTQSKVRKLALDVEMSAALDALGVEAKQDRDARGMSPLDLLRRYCSDRKTTKRLGAQVMRNGRIVYATWYEHKANAGLRFHRRLELVDTRV